MAAMKASALRIKEFTNPSGAIAYRVEGVGAEGYIRRNFKTYEEALAQKQTEENKIANLPTVRLVPWRWSLTEAQVDDAALAIATLPDGMGLLQAVTFAA